jgi:5-hydroxyisourate hydrolase-like protein (transthyretin family)
MSPKNRKVLIVIFVLVTVIGGLWGLTSYYNDLPNKISQHETILLGQNRFVPGSQAGLRVVVRDSKNASPLEGAEISVSLRPREGGKKIEVFHGKTDDQGSTDMEFSVPETTESNYTMIVETKSDLGSDTVERDVTLDREYRVLLTTDKPIYQPGQEIHIRLLALSAFDLIPAAGQEIEVIIADGKGNKVHRETLTTSEYGIAATDFQLANEVNNGNYKISAAMGNTSSEKTVTVEHYVLPKFEIALEPERTFYTPGQTVNGTINANYFFGKPVSDGEVTIEGYTFDFERVVTTTIDGETDENGNFEFSFNLPDYIAGSDLEGGQARFFIQASITDQAEHTEVSNLSLPISSSGLVIEAIPEGGQFRQGVENILYVLTSYPDGTPAECSLTIEFYYEQETIQTVTGGYGLAEVGFLPDQPYQEFSITARDHRGNTATQNFYFEGNWEEETVLLRPEKPVYQVGETMALTILTSQQAGTAYVDIVREGQTVSTRSIQIQNGQAQVAIDLTPDLYGTLEIHAYKILSWGAIVRDTRLVVVDNADDLMLTLNPEQDTYLPGENASLDILVQDNHGSGAQAAIGLAIVDESVFALAQQDPGFAKLYFMLEQELLQPKYELHGFSVPALVDGVPVSSQPFVEAIEDAATASLAAAIPQQISFSLQANSHQEAMQRAYARQQQYYSTLSIGFYALSIVLPFVALFFNGRAVWREKQLGRSLALSLGILVLLAWTLYLSQFFWYGSSFLLFIVGGLGLISLISLIVIAVKEKDKILRVTLGVIPVFLLSVFLTILSVEEGGVYPSDGILILGLIAFFMFPITFVLRSASFALGKQIGPSLASLGVGFLFLIGAIPLTFLGFLGITGGGMMGAPMVQDEVFFEAEAGAMRKEVGENAMPLLAAGAPDAIDEDKSVGTDGTTTASAAEPPRLRQYFPETMLWSPDLVTDKQGNLHIDFDVMVA